MSTIDLENMNLESMSPEELDALMDSIEPTEGGQYKLKDGSAAAPNPEEAAEPKPDEQKPVEEQVKEKVVEKATTATEPNRDDKGKFIATKNGEGKIPYGVLEAERAQSRQYREQLEQQQAAHAEAMRKLDVLQKQLETAGMKPGDLPEDIKIDDKEIQAISDDFPEVGKIMRAMAAKIDYLQGQSKPAAAAEPTGNPVADAINAIPDLADWQKNDEDKFKFAVHIDEQLKSQPEWKDKTLSERFNEVTNRVKQAYGEVVPEPKKAEPSTEELQKKAEQMQKEAKAAAEIPASPSDLGNATVSSERSLMDRAADASGEELNVLMSKMNDKELEAFMSSVMMSRE